MTDESNGAKDYRTERAKLVLELRRAGVTDDDVLAAIERTPREIFVPETFRRHAYDNSALPIAEGQTISQPQIVGVMTQALAPTKRSKVLEVGTGSGYQAVILSYLCRRLYTIERRRDLLRQAESIFRELDRPNITTKYGDGFAGWPEQAPFDRIMVTAAATEIPKPLLDQLAPDGILVIPVGPDAAQDPLGAQELLRVTKAADGSPETTHLGGVRFVPLVPGVEGGR